VRCGRGRDQDDSADCSRPEKRPKKLGKSKGKVEENAVLRHRDLKENNNTEDGGGETGEEAEKLKRVKANARVMQGRSRKKEEVVPHLPYWEARN